MDHGVQSTLTQSQRVEKHSELCHADFKDVRGYLYDKWYSWKT